MTSKTNTQPAADITITPPTADGWTVEDLPGMVRATNSGNGEIREVPVSGEPGSRQAAHSVIAQGFREDAGLPVHATAGTLAAEMCQPQIILDDLRQVTIELIDAKRNHVQAIRDAARDGLSYRLIAEAVGLSHQRVAQIVQGDTKLACICAQMGADPSLGQHHTLCPAHH